MTATAQTRRQDLVHRPRGGRLRAGVCGVLLLFALAPIPARGETDVPGIDERLGAVLPAGLALNDETGQPVILRQIIDKPTIITFNYFRCGGICTPQLNNLARTLNEIDLEPGRDFQVITVSFDPRDTAAIAAEKRTNYLKLLKRPVPPLAWRFLTGEQAATQALTQALGFGFQKHGEDFVHPGALIMLSPQGKVTRYLYGITYLPADVQMAVNEAASGQIRPTISTALSFCYSYDPAARQYVVNVTRIAGAATLVLAGILATVVWFLSRNRGRTERAS